MTTYTITFEETSFLPVRQYDVKTLDSLMRVIRVEKRNALYDLTVTLSKIERDDEMPIKGEIVDEVQFSISKNSPALQAEINKLNAEVAYRDRKIEQLEQQIRGLESQFDEAKEQIRQLKNLQSWQQAEKEFADKIKAKLNAIYGKTICSDLDTEDITDIIDELLKEYK